MKKVLVFLIGSCLVALFLLTGCTSSTKTPVMPTPLPPTSVPTEVKVFPTPSSSGDAVTWGDLQFRMGSAEITDSFMNKFGSERVPSAGHKFLWVLVRLENKGKNEIILPTSEHFSALYANSEFKPTYGHRQGYADYTALTSPLFPGQSVDAWLRFDIPETAQLTELWFVFMPESFQIGVLPSSPDYPWGGRHPVFAWRCGQ